MPERVLAAFRHPHPVHVRQSLVIQVVHPGVAFRQVSSGQEAPVPRTCIDRRHAAVAEELEIDVGTHFSRRVRVLCKERWTAIQPCKVLVVLHQRLPRPAPMRVRARVRVKRVHAYLADTEDRHHLAAVPVPVLLQLRLHSPDFLGLRRLVRRLPVHAGHAEVLVRIPENPVQAGLIPHRLDSLQQVLPEIGPEPAAIQRLVVPVPRIAVGFPQEPVGMLLPQGRTGIELHAEPLPHADSVLVGLVEQAFHVLRPAERLRVHVIVVAADVAPVAVRVARPLPYAVREHIVVTEFLVFRQCLEQVVYPCRAESVQLGTPQEHPELGTSDFQFEPVVLVDPPPDFRETVQPQVPPLVLCQDSRMASHEQFPLGQHGLLGQREERAIGVVDHVLVSELLQPCACQAGLLGKQAQREIVLHLEIQRRSSGATRKHVHGEAACQLTGPGRRVLCGRVKPFDRAEPAVWFDPLFQVDAAHVLLHEHTTGRCAPNFPRGVFQHPVDRLSGRFNAKPHGKPRPLLVPNPLCNRPEGPPKGRRGPFDPPAPHPCVAHGIGFLDARQPGPLGREHDHSRTIRLLRVHEPEFVESEPFFRFRVDNPRQLRAAQGRHTVANIPNPQETLAVQGQRQFELISKPDCPGCIHILANISKSTERCPAGKTARA